MMDRKRLRFVICLVLFLAWVGALTALAFTTSRRPRAATETASEGEPLSPEAGRVR